MKWRIAISVKKQHVPEVGRAMYEKMRAEMEANHWGKMVVIDVNTGDYEVAADDLTATRRLFERRPNAVTWGELAGYPAPYFMRGPVPMPMPRTGQDDD